MRNLHDALSLLWEKAEERITFKEAQGMSNADDLACYLAKDLDDVCSNLAGLMASDADSGRSSGWLQMPDDIQKLLRIFGSSFDILAALTELGQKANERKHSLMGLYEPKTYERMTHEQQEVNP